MVLDEHWVDKNAQGLHSSCQISTLLFTHYFECASWKENNDSFQSQSQIKYLFWSPDDPTVGCWRNYPLTFLLLTLSSPEVVGMGVGKNDTHVSLCQCPSFLAPSFCWTQLILFLLYYLWPINMERRSNYRPFSGEYQSPFPTVLLIEWLGEGFGA